MDERTDMPTPERQDSLNAEVARASSEQVLDDLFDRLDLPDATQESVGVGEAWTAGELTLPRTPTATNLRGALDAVMVSEGAPTAQQAVSEDLTATDRWRPLLEAAVIILAVLGILAFWWLWW